MKVGDRVKAKVTTRALTPNGPSNVIQTHEITGIVVSLDKPGMVTIRLGRTDVDCPAETAIVVAPAQAEPPKITDSAVADFIVGMRNPNPAKLEEAKKRILEAREKDNEQAKISK